MRKARPEPLLATKVVPPRGVGLIERPRLLDMVSQLPAKRLVVIKSPAGFGKTSLAISWSERLRQSGNAVAWFSIDPDDNAPGRFLLYLCEALQRTCAGLGLATLDLLKESLLIRPFIIVSMLINELMDIDEEIYLFLEDYHWVTDHEIHEAMAFFLKHTPSHCHILLTTRTEPPIPLASARAQNQLLELDASALRFDLEETQSLLQREKLGNVDPSDLKVLHSKTEGWPAALRIVLCSTQPGHDFGRYVRNLEGTHQPIGFYLAEMLDGLSDQLALFMLRSAVLDRLSAQSCEAVTGESASAMLLRLMEKRQLLLTPLDQEGRWYRYHPLLAEYLKDRLQSEHSVEVPGLHQRAAAWYAAQHLWADAVQHAILGGDTDRAVGFIKNCAMSLVKKGDLFTLLRWQRQLPPGMIRNQPEVRIAIAWGLALAMRFEEALQLVQELEHDLGTEPSFDRGVLACECLVIRSVVLALQDDSQSALHLVQQSLPCTTDPWTANVASNVVRYGHLKAGNLKEFHATPWIPYSVDEDRRNVFASVYRRSIQGMCEIQQLRFIAANRYCSEGLRLAERYVGSNSVAAALPASLLAQLRYEEGRVDEAETMLLDRLSILRAGAIIECVLSAYLVLARIAEHRANPDWAHALLEQAEELAITRRWGRLSAAAALERGRLYLHERRTTEGIAYFDRIQRLAAEYPVSERCAWSDIHRYAALARGYVAAAEMRVEHAISILSELHLEAEAAHNRYFMIRVATLLLIIQFTTNKSATVLDSFGRVLNIAASAGIYNTILDEGRDVGPLLLAFRLRIEGKGIFRDLLPYVTKLIMGWQSRYGSQAQQMARSVPPELLSNREEEILKLIGKGLSNKDIARTLAIAPETVKSHVKHIFLKLGAANRAHAVSRAKSFGFAR